MRPVLFTWRGRAVPSYPAMLYLGAVAGLAAGNVAANATGLNAARVYGASLVLLPVALVGARLASVVGNRKVYRGTPGRIWRRSEGGQAMYGGLIAVPLSVPLLAVLHLPFWAFWDVGAFTLLTGMVFARVGCLLTGCCAGRLTRSRFGMLLADHRGVRARRIPTQLLEAGVGIVLLGAAAGMAAAQAPPGAVFTGSLGAYALARLFLQPLRATQSRVAGIPALRAVSVALFVYALVSILPRLS
jgi:phosphatidylglycerol---prolipoprotein diacylglyceryl transferase